MTWQLFCGDPGVKCVRLCLFLACDMCMSVHLCGGLGPCLIVFVTTILITAKQVIDRKIHSSLVPA